MNCWPPVPPRQPTAPRDFITFEYCMLEGANDTPELARELVTWSRAACRASST